MKRNGVKELSFLLSRIASSEKARDKITNRHKEHCRGIKELRRERNSHAARLKSLTIAHASTMAA